MKTHFWQIGDFIMYEPSTTLTDAFLLAICLYFAAFLARGEKTVVMGCWIAFFLSIGGAALSGVLSHGFLVDIFLLVLISLGITTISLEIIVLYEWQALYQRRPLLVNVFQAVFVLQLLTYFVVIIFVSQAFGVAVLNYIPVCVAVSVAFYAFSVKAPALGFWKLSVGFVMSIFAGGIQALKISISDVYFNHNDLYHVVQALSLWVIFLGILERRESVLRGKIVEKKK